jgi:hypothetical protein
VPARVTVHAAAELTTSDDAISLEDVLSVRFDTQTHAAVAQSRERWLLADAFAAATGITGITLNDSEFGRVTFRHEVNLPNETFTGSIQVDRWLDYDSRSSDFPSLSW